MIKVKFKKFPELMISIDNTELGLKYQQLVKENYDKKFPIYRDRLKYTKEYMLELAEEAKQKLGWQWTSDSYSLDITAQLHKDIELLVGQGFDNIPEEFDNLIHELHYCLHYVQGNQKPTRNGWLQIEWFNDSGFDLIDTSIFREQLKKGRCKITKSVCWSQSYANICGKRFYKFKPNM